MMDAVDSCVLGKVKCCSVGAVVNYLLSEDEAGEGRRK